MEASGHWEGQTPPLKVAEPLQKLVSWDREPPFRDCTNSDKTEEMYP